MLLEEFDNWRKERESSPKVIHMPTGMCAFTSGFEWRDDFDLFIRFRYCETITNEDFADLAWQVYMMQACIEGFLDDFEEIQDELVRQDECIRTLTSDLDALWSEV
jgi:hypothetical protein